MSKPSEVAVIDLTNTTNSPLRISVMIGGVEHHIVTLQHGETTRQVTPSGVSWTLGAEPEETDGQTDPGAGDGDGDGDGEIVEDGGSKGGVRGGH